ncbi:uncharacterized protein B0H64DRAFT_421927 [Chaetomium fimeti]|uniref:DnaJ-like protein C11 C-terminal domain-containing protein n=1 Tax=Chaetomium fimeti TaxID=1854472 RepID=A0AAE0HRG9_9PEZI|nr:hypothetical protein B0H64DRAFT_421927 [Chaetomium fimeti]
MTASHRNQSIISRRAPSTAVNDGSSGSRSRNHRSSSHRPPRPPSTRHSLRSQFATTRQEYEFGFDDASSIAEQSIQASEAVQGNEADNHNPAFSRGRVLGRDCYELLCLPRGPSLSPDQVQEAAYRLAQVLAVDKQPQRLQVPAAFQLGLVKAAVETLIDPSRRLGYDLSRAGKPDSDSDEEDIYENDPDSGSNGSYEVGVQEQYLLLSQRESRAGTDLSLRLDATSLVASRGELLRHGVGPEVMDFSLQKTATTGVPALRRPIESAAVFIRNLGIRKSPKAKAASRLRLTDPTVTVTASAHGLLGEPFKLAPLLVDRYQPPGPSTSIHGKRRVEQLLASRFLPFLSLNFRQELFWQTEPVPVALPKLVIEQELEFLPHPSTTTRIGQSINLFGSANPLNVEISAQKALARKSEPLPNVGLAVHQRVGPGTAFLVANGGDWNLRTSKECRQLFKFSKQRSRGLTPVLDAFSNPPTVEIGYAFGRRDLGMRSGQTLTKPTTRGLSRLDGDVDEQTLSSWSVSTGLSPGTAATYLRYGRDLFTSPSPQQRHRTTNTGGFRAEAEVAATTQHDFSVAFRALKHVGRFTKAGLEVGLSPTNLHVALYWSRLGQRVSLPFLAAATTAPHTTLTPPLNHLLLTTLLLPLTAFSAWEAYAHLQRARRATEAVRARRERQLAAYVAARRAEADELTVALAAGVGPRQAAARKRGGLVVLSAKFGVRGAPPDEGEGIGGGEDSDSEEDDEDELVIPRGVRKGRLMGFWDPAPGKEKVLRVVYLWEGKEKVAEVSGREELRLP